MAAHRFWRLRIPRKVSNQSYVYLGDVYLALSAGGADIVPTATLSASSSFSSTYLVEKLADNNSATYWSSAAGTYAGTSGNMEGDEWVQFEFATAQDIVEMRIRTNTSGTAQWPMHLVLLWSDDGVSWHIQNAWYDIVWGTAGSTVVFPATEAFVGPGRFVDRVHRYIGSYELQPSAPVGRLDRSNSGTRFLNWTRPWKTSWLTGKKRIAGSTTVLGMPKARTVHLLLQRNHQILDTRHTDASGLFEFPFIADLPYTLVGEDRTGEQNSVIYANVTPVD